MHVLRRATENQEIPLELPKPSGRVQMLRTAMHRYMQMLLRILQRDWELCKYTAGPYKKHANTAQSEWKIHASTTQSQMKERVSTVGTVEDSA